MKASFIGFFLLALAVSQNCKAVSVSHTLEVKVGIFDAAKCTMYYSFDDIKYNAESKVETTGIFGGIYPFVGKYTSGGKINGDNLITQTYRYLAKSRFNTRTKELVYDDKGNLLYRLSSKNDKVKKSDISAKKENSGATDLQTVFVMLAKQVAQKGYCASEYPVFDGKKSFKVGFIDLGAQKSVEKNQKFSGDELLCSIYIDNGGQKNDDLLFDNTAEKRVIISLARSEKSGVPFVTQIRVSGSPLGEIVAKTTSIKIEE